MSIFIDAKNALSHLVQGEWREFALRIRVHLGTINLKMDRLDELPTERTHPYSDSSGIKLKKVLNSLGIAPQDAIVDFGSGKGGALITFSRYLFAKITGVEISPELVAIAEDNLKKLKISNVDMVVCDAADFTDLARYNYFYFFSPFPGEVMQQVIENIETSLTVKPRKAVIIYLNPESHNTIIENSSFKKVDEYNHHVLRFYIYTNI